MEDFEEKLYRRLCWNCPQAKYCHDECTFCEEYLKEVEEHDNQTTNKL